MYRIICDVQYISFFADPFAANMPNQLAAQDDKGLCPWDCLPDDILLGIFQCLPARELLRVSQVWDSLSIWENEGPFTPHPPL